MALWSSHQNIPIFGPCRLSIKTCLHPLSCEKIVEIGPRCAYTIPTIACPGYVVLHLTAAPSVERWKVCARERSFHILSRSEWTREGGYTPTKHTQNTRQTETADSTVQETPTHRQNTHRTQRATLAIVRHVDGRPSSGTSINNINSTSHLTTLYTSTENNENTAYITQPAGLHHNRRHAAFTPESPNNQPQPL